MIKPFPCVALLIGVALTGTPSFVARAADITVFAASSMTEAVSEIGESYTQQSNKDDVRYVFAASSTLARQIIAGAPAQIYISANPAWMHETVDEGAVDNETVVQITSNRLVLVSAPHANAVLSGDLPTIITPIFPLPQLLGTHSNSRLAMGDPTHVPAGQYARQALVSLGLWHTVSDRLAPMPHVRSALNLVVRGEAPIGIVYASDVRLTPSVRVLASFPADSHLPIIYLAGLVRSDATSAQQMNGAKAFLSYLTSPEAAQVFQRHGFSSILSDSD